MYIRVVQAGNGWHAGIIPTVHMPFSHQLSQFTLAHHRVLQIEAGKFNLLRTTSDADVVQHPVIERAVILKLECAQRVGNTLERIGDRVGIVVHRIDAPGFAGLMVNDAMPDAVEVGSRIFRLGDAISIRARSTREPSSNSPARMRLNRARFSSTLRLR